MSNEDAEEWDYLAQDYARVFLPRFQPIYDAICSLLSSKDEQVLDFGSGPGEPALTIAKKLGTNVIVSDFSHRMLQVARTRFEGIENVSFVDLSSSSRLDQDIGSVNAIVSSLCLNYIDDVATTLAQLRALMLKDKMSKLIVSYWSSPDQVPFLAAIKLVFGVDDENGPVDQIDIPLVSTLNEDASFGWSCKDRASSLLEANGFHPVQTEYETLPMTFTNVYELLSFGTGEFSSPLWSDSTKKHRAGQILLRVLRERFQVLPASGIPTDDQSELTMTSQATIVVAHLK